VTLDRSSKLFNIIGKEEISVNSRHKYVIKDEENIKDKFDIVGMSEDGFPEAMEVKTRRFFIGVQWHPENMVDIDINMKKIFDSLVEEAKK
jgi:putative glutamine amidotransferase